ncbi:hypothetical protein GGD61_003917 [Bradyrhizobium sp. SBR1B]|nr:hypothetical protein [Bradyrhizobium sp. SBR1B]
MHRKSSLEGGTAELAAGLSPFEASATLGTSG